jgi:SAM-dependent methyltransferase
MKKLRTYQNYFYYLAKNLSVSLALFVLYYEIKGEGKYHIDTSGIDTLDDLEEKGVDLSHASIYQPLNYYILDKLMKETKRWNHNKTFLDIGCGKGRALAVAAWYGFENITGIDFSTALCRAAKKTTDGCAARFPAARFTIVNNDAFYYEIPSNVTTIFLFNPFDEVIMSAVVSNIVKSQELFPRTIRVLYANPLYASLFLDEGFVETGHFKKMEYLEGAILEKKAVG